MAKEPNTKSKYASKILAHVSSESSDAAWIRFGLPSSRGAYVTASVIIVTAADIAK